MATSMEGSEIPSGSNFLIAPRVPRGLAAAVEGLTREVLRHRPEDIYVFAARHFERLLKLREKYGLREPAECNVQLRGSHSEARKYGLHRGSASRRTAKKELADKRGWSFNETANVLERHRSIFGEDGNRISTKDVRALANGKTPRGSPKSRENFTRRSAKTSNGQAFLEFQNQQILSKQQSESLEESSEEKAGQKVVIPRLISQAPTLPSRTGNLTKDIKYELRRNRLGGRSKAVTEKELRLRTEKSQDKTSASDVESNDFTSKASRNTSRRPLEKVNKINEDSLEHRNDRSRTRAKKSDARAEKTRAFSSSRKESSRARSMDRGKDYVVRTFATAQSLEELQSPKYVEKVQEIIDRTAPIIRDKVEELKNVVLARSKRSADSAPTIDHDQHSQSQSQQDVALEIGAGRDESQEQQQPEQSILENVPTKCHTKSQLTRKSSSSKEPSVSDSSDHQETSCGSSSKVSLPAVRPLSSKSNRSLSKNDSDNLILPPISPDAQKAPKKKDDISLPLLPQASSNVASEDSASEMTMAPSFATPTVDQIDNVEHLLQSPESEKALSQVEKSQSIEADILRNAEDVILQKDSAEEDAKVNDDIKNLDLEEEELLIQETGVLGKTIAEEVFKDSLNVTPEVIDIPPRPDSLEPEESQKYGEGDGEVKRMGLSDKLMELELAEQNVAKALESQLSKKLEPEEVTQPKPELQENTQRDLSESTTEDASMNIKDKLQELEETEKRIEKILGSESFVQQNALNVTSKDVTDRVLDSVMDVEKFEHGESEEKVTSDLKQEADVQERTTIHETLDDRISLSTDVAEEVLKDTEVSAKNSDDEVAKELITIAAENDPLTSLDSSSVEIGDAGTHASCDRERRESDDADEQVDREVRLANQRANNNGDEASKSSPKEIPFSYVLTEGSPCEIPESVTTVIIPDRPLVSPDSEIEAILEPEFQSEDVAAILMHPCLENVQLQNQLLKSSTEPFGEYIKPDSADCSTIDIDFIRGIKASHDMLVAKQDLDNIKEEEEDDATGDNGDINSNQTFEKSSTTALENIVEEKSPESKSSSMADEAKGSGETESRVLEERVQVLLETRKEVIEDGKTDSSKVSKPTVESDSTDEAKETSNAECVTEAENLIENEISLDAEESTEARSTESTNEVKETTITDRSAESLSLDPARPVVPELNLDSLQDITLSSFKVTDNEDAEDTGKRDSDVTRGSDEIFSLSENLTSDEKMNEETVTAAGPCDSTNELETCAKEKEESEEVIEKKTWPISGSDDGIEDVSEPGLVEVEVVVDRKNGHRAAVRDGSPTRQESEENIEEQIAKELIEIVRSEEIFSAKESISDEERRDKLDDVGKKEDDSYDLSICLKGDKEAEKESSAREVGTENISLRNENAEPCISFVDTDRENYIEKASPTQETKDEAVSVTEGLGETDRKGISDLQIDLEVPTETVTSSMKEAEETDYVDTGNAGDDKQTTSTSGERTGEFKIVTKVLSDGSELEISDVLLHQKDEIRETDSQPSLENEREVSVHVGAEDEKRDEIIVRSESSTGTTSDSIDRKNSAKDEIDTEGQPLNDEAAAATTGEQSNGDVDASQVESGDKVIVSFNGNESDHDGTADERRECHVYMPKTTDCESNSSESTSTIQTAVTKIQAGVRGFLTRRRLRSTQVNRSTLDSVPSIQDSIAAEPYIPTVSTTVAADATPEAVPDAADAALQKEQAEMGQLRELKAKQRLRREDAMQKTTLSLENAFAASGLQHTGEFHDCLPLPLLDATALSEGFLTKSQDKPVDGDATEKTGSAKRESEEPDSVKSQPESGTRKIGDVKETESESARTNGSTANDAMEESKERSELTTPSTATSVSQSLESIDTPEKDSSLNIQGIPEEPSDSDIKRPSVPEIPVHVIADASQFPKPAMEHIVDLLMMQFVKDDSTLQNRYLNFITSVEDVDSAQSSPLNVGNAIFIQGVPPGKMDLHYEKELDDSSGCHSGSLREPLAVPGTPAGIVIEEITSLDRESMPEDQNDLLNSKERTCEAQNSEKSQEVPKNESLQKSKNGESVTGIVEDSPVSDDNVKRSTDNEINVETGSPTSVSDKQEKPDSFDGREKDLPVSSPDRPQKSSSASDAVDLQNDSDVSKSDEPLRKESGAFSKDAIARGSSESSAESSADAVPVEQSVKSSESTRDVVEKAKEEDENENENKNISMSGESDRRELAEPRSEEEKEGDVERDSSESTVAPTSNAPGSSIVLHMHLSPKESFGSTNTSQESEDGVERLASPVTMMQIAPNTSVDTVDEVEGSCTPSRSKE